MKTRFFYDVEFMENGQNISLISVGIVKRRPDGSVATYYAVSSAMDFEGAMSNLFLKGNVLPHLPLVPRRRMGYAVEKWLDYTHPSVKSLPVIAKEVHDFIASFEMPEEADREMWAYYGGYDQVALAQLWGPLVNMPLCIPRYTHDLMTLWKMAGCPKKPENSETKHHALADAQWNMDLFDTCTRILRRSQHLVKTFLQ